MLVRLAASAALLCLAFNATAAKLQPLPMPIAEQLPVELVMSQQEIAVDVPNTASAMGAQFGLIGALIGSAVQNSQVKSAEQRVAEIRNLLIDYRFNERMEQALRARLAGEGISPNPVVVVMPSPWDAASAMDGATLPQDVLVVTPGHAMTYAMDGLSVRATVSLVHRERKSNGKVKQTIRFSRPYGFQFALSAPPAEGETEGGWMGLGKTGMAAVVDKGVEQLADMIAYDFSAAGRAEAQAKVKADKVPFAGRIYRGRSVRSTDAYLWLRSGNGWMQTLQGYEVLEPAELTAMAQVAAAAPAAVATPAAAPATVPATPAATSAPATGSGAGSL
jgi:hypothetical protein